VVSGIRGKMERFFVYLLDNNSFVVADQVLSKEICVCSNYDDVEDAEGRANQICFLLNSSNESIE
jgi:hypothetical protein